MAESRSTARERAGVLGVPIDALDWSTALERISKWARRGESRYVCICNSHSVVTATGDDAFADAIATSDMATPDGAPVAWMLRRLGHLTQARINGPDLMWKYLELAAASAEPVFFYGSTQATLDRLVARMGLLLPGLVIAGVHSPPFRPLMEEEDSAIVDRINRSGARTVWVSLGCPKQELWMAAHRGRIDAVMLGVGAAFDFHSGLRSRAPCWMRQAGLEWLHRLASEPQRLWRRYLVTNSAFAWGATRQLLARAWGREK